MSNLTWNSDNRNKPTPMFISNFYNALLFLTAIWVGSIEAYIRIYYPHIDMNTLHLVDVILLESALIIREFCKFFGFAAPQDLSQNVTVNTNTTTNTETTVTTKPAISEPEKPSMDA